MTNPKSGHCYADYYWVVTPRNHLIFYPIGGGSDYSPQSNSNKNVVEHLIPRMYPNCIAEHIPAVFMGNLSLQSAHGLRDEWLSKSRIITAADEAYKLYKENGIDALRDLPEDIKTFIATDSVSPLSQEEIVFLMMVN